MVTAFHPNTRRISIFSRLRQWVLPGLVLTIATTLVSCASTGDTPSDQVEIKAKTIRIGYQKSSTLIKTEGVLEERLEPLGVTVEWKEFAAGLPLLEALNVGGVDIGSTGDSPPIYAQAAGADLVYVATTVPNGATRAILVKADSPFQTVADLKGRKVAIQKGSGTHYFLLQAIEKAGLDPEKDVKFAYLPPADGRSAFEQGSVDAWATWDPYYGLAERDMKVRTIASGADYATQGSFYLASRSFVEENPEAIKIILEEIEKLNQWSNNNPQKVAEILSPELGIEKPVLEVMQGRQRSGLRPITEDVIQIQQEIADEFHNLSLIPRKIDVREAMLTPEEYARITPEMINNK